jgi:tRNA(fMet)-specific endonuclease VapC
VNKLTLMTGNRVLLDTNIIAAFINGDDMIINNIDSYDEVCIPVIVLGELYYGAAYSAKIDQNIASTLRISQAYNILNTDNETASVYGHIKAQLRKNGTPIPENDIWIAAFALQHNIPLATRDKHFKHIDKLDLLDW